MGKGIKIWGPCQRRKEGKGRRSVIKLKRDHGMNVSPNDNTNGKKGGRNDRVEVNQE